jgi:hypothetical protein
MPLDKVGDQSMHLRYGSINRIFLICTIVVAASTIVLPTVGGYGTVIFQIVVLGAWGILAAVRSGQYADFHHGQLLSSALALNVLIFLIPAAILWLITRRKWPAPGAVVITVWCALYLSFLFFLVPATDGP